MDQHNQYTKLGKFKKKKDMWLQISADLRAALNVFRTPEKCSDRFKSIRYTEIKRKQKELELLAIQNAQAGLTPEQREYANQKQREGTKYEVVFVKDVKVRPPAEMAAAPTDTGATISGVMLLRSTMLEIHRKTEESSERRHQEQMAADDRRHQELMQNMERRHAELLAARSNY